MSADLSEQAVQRAAALIAAADGLVITAGAGLGVDSGLPDFRGNSGFWQAYPALAQAGLDFRGIATPLAFKRDPAQAWGFYGHRLVVYRRTAPHAGFRLLKKWGQTRPHGYTVFTSNVDGHFQVAGFPAQHVHECHGSIHYLQCTLPCSEDVWDADGLDADVDEVACRLRNPAPRCPRCARLARPNILMFEDWGWISARTDEQAARQQVRLAQMRRPVVVEIGAGKAIATVRHFSERIVRQHGGSLVRINPRDHEVARPGDVGLQMGALEALLAIDAVLEAAL